MGELIAFFHQPEHWRTHADVVAFLGSCHEGALRLLWEAYYEPLRDVWPPDVAAKLGTGEL